MSGHGRFVLAELAARGIDTVFGIPGVHTVPLYDGLAESGVRHVTPRHEQAAGFMADGFARVAGRPAACFVISGPGLTNVLTAMGQAHAESVPMLVISSVSRREHMAHGLGRLHELPDQRAMAAGVSAFSHTLHALSDLPAVLDRAMALFAAGRPRPVHVEIPLDLWDASPPTDTPLPAVRPPSPVPPQVSITAAAERLAAARRPVILAGGGARHAVGELRAVAERLDAPVVMTVNARGLLPPDHPLAVPASPSLPAVRALIADADAVLAVGTELGATDYDMYETGMPVIAAPLVRIDVDPAQLSRGARADHPLTGAAAETLSALAAALGQCVAAGDGAARAATAMVEARNLPEATAKAVALLERLRDAVPEAAMVGDSTQPVYAGNLVFGATRPGAWFNSATGFGTLGYGLPAAIGAALADPARPVICLTGDGGLHYSLGELATLAQTGARVVVLVWNNESYGEIKAAMQAEGVAPAGVDLLTPDFETLAAAYGLPAERPRTLDAVVEAVRQGTGRDGPSIVCLDEAVALG